MIKALLKKHIFIVGWISLSLGVLGIFLPLLPTTVFILFAGYCFGKSSPKTHAWLVSNKTFGPIICSWEKDRSIPKNVKKIALTSIFCCFLITSLVSGFQPLFLFLFVSLGIFLMIFIATRPTSSSQEHKQNS